jgi:hypothetical protein
MILQLCTECLYPSEVTQAAEPHTSYRTPQNRVGGGGEDLQGSKAELRKVQRAEFRHHNTTPRVHHQIRSSFTYFIFTVSHWSPCHQPFTTQIMQMPPDMPMEVPVDDPNADTEWSVRVRRVSLRALLTRAPGTIFCANMASSPRSRRRRHR